jgi:hypothetical protein
MGEAVPGRAGDVRCEDGDALSEEILVEARVGVLGAFLGFGASVDRQQHGVWSACVRTVEQRVHVTFVACGISDHVRLDRSRGLDRWRAGVGEVPEAGREIKKADLARPGW